MSEATLQLGNGKWAVKSGNILGYHTYQADKLKYFPNELNFTRASTATRVAENGLIESVASGVPRIDFTGGEGKLLLEPQRTNLATYSNGFDDASWSSTRMIETPNSATSPDGTINAYLIECTVSGLSKCYNTNISYTSGVFYTMSFFAKYNNQSRLNLSLNGGVFSTASNVFDIQNGTLISGDGTIEDYGNGWYRIIVTRQANTTITSNGFGIQFQDEFTGSGVAGDKAYIYGAQMEVGTYPTSYIPTAGSTVTRVADASATSGLSSVINSVEGVLFADVIFFGGSFKFITINSGSSSNRVAIFSSNATQISYNVRVGGVNQFNGNFTIDSTIRHKLALKYKANDFALWIDGVEVVTLASGTTFSASTLTNFSLDDGGGGSVFNGLIQDLAIFPTALSDAELIDLTTL